MRFVQLVLTDTQAELTAAALRSAEKELRAEHLPGELTEETAADAAQLGRLSMLFQDASEFPAKYPPTGRMAGTVRSIIRRAKGASQPNSRRHPRKERQARRQKYRQEQRKERREITESYNQARQIIEDEQREHQAAVDALAERVKDQPKFTVTDGFGNPVMAGIPREFILNEEGEPAFPTIVVAK